MATHSSTLAWRIPWREESGRLQSMVSQRVGHDSVTSLSLSHGEEWKPPVNNLSVMSVNRLGSGSSSHSQAFG